VTEKGDSMKKNISLVMREAKYKLTRLGLALFYVYILLTLASVAGFVYGVLGMIMKLIQIGSSVNTSWAEVILLTLVCAFSTKFFLRESIALTQPDKIQNTDDRDYEEQPEAVDNSNVVQFKRKSNW
jgi:hypothetical protein